MAPVFSNEHKNANFLLPMLTTSLFLLLVIFTHNVFSIDGYPKELDGTPLPMSDTAYIRQMSPDICTCKKSKSQHAGTCHYFTNEEKHDCDTRKCHPSYECVNYQTGVTCKRHQVTHKLINMGYGKCKRYNEVKNVYMPISTTG